MPPNGMPTIPIRAATKRQTPLLLTFIKEVTSRENFSLEYDVNWEEIGDAMGDEDFPNDDDVDDEGNGNRRRRALEDFEKTFEDLQTPVTSLEDATMEDLEIELVEHERKAEAVKEKIEKIRHELDVKREMKIDEDRQRAEQERLAREKRESRTKAEEKVKQRKRKLEHDSDDDDVKVKRERR